MNYFFMRTGLREICKLCGNCCSRETCEDKGREDGCRNKVCVGYACAHLTYIMPSDLRSFYDTLYFGFKEDHFTDCIIMIDQLAKKYRKRFVELASNISEIIKSNNILELLYLIVDHPELSPLLLQIFKYKDSNNYLDEAIELAEKRDEETLRLCMAIGVNDD